MNELIGISNRVRPFRIALLASVAAMAFACYVGSDGDAYAEEQSESNPTVWIELGGQLEDLHASEQPFAPSFTAHLPANYFSPIQMQDSLKSTFGGAGSLKFEPRNSDWVFMAYVRFGRATGARHDHQQTANAKIPLKVHFGPPFYTAYPSKYYAQGSYYPRIHAKFADEKVQKSTSHAILDFQAGKEVGLGLFGRSASSVLGVGIRYAQFSSRTSVSIAALPDLQYPTAPITNKYELQAFRNTHLNFHAYTAVASAERTFRGIGPSLSWKNSIPIVGSAERMEVALDWGFNGALLFGRQKSKGHHQSTVRTYHPTDWERGINGINGCGLSDNCEKPGFFNLGGDHYYFSATHHGTARSFHRNSTIIVPNLGGFAGLSFLYRDAKISFGYRADFFLGAMDGGIDQRQTKGVGFFGPFASISIGLGG